MFHSEVSIISDFWTEKQIQKENLTKASEILHISQPAVTKHIKNLENLVKEYRNGIEDLNKLIREKAGNIKWIHIQFKRDKNKERGLIYPK